MKVKENGWKKCFGVPTLESQNVGQTSVYVPNPKLVIMPDSSIMANFKLVFVNYPIFDHAFLREAEQNN